MTTPATDAASLTARALDLGLRLPPGSAERMLAYLDAVLAANARINLTRVTERGHAIARHLVDSLAFGLHLRDRPSRPARILDLGTGGGFPGVPAALALPEATVTLVEGRARKVEAVRALLEAGRITNAVPVWGRLSELLARGDLRPATFDLVLARAVAPLAELVRESAAALAPGGVLLCWKSRGLGDVERHQGDRRADAAGLLRLLDLDYASDAPSRLVRYLKESR